MYPRKQQGYVYGDFNAGYNVPIIGASGVSGGVSGHCWLAAPCVSQHSYINVTNWEGIGVMVNSAPTPVPTQNNSYCGEIDEGSGEGGFLNEDGLFVIPVPGLHEAQCLVLMPEFTIPASAINWIPGISLENDVDWPGLTLCIRGMVFGTLVILGLSIDLDFYARLIGSIMMLRKVLRS